MLSKLGINKVIYRKKKAGKGHVRVDRWQAHSE